MKRLMTSAIVLSLLGSGAALAQNQPGMQYRGVPYNRGDQQRSAQSQAAGGGGAQFQRQDRGDQGGQARQERQERQDRGGNGGGQSQDRGQRPQPQQQAQQPEVQPQPQQARQPRPDRDDNRSRPGALNDNRPTTPNGAPNPNRGDARNQNGGINPDPRYDWRNNNRDPRNDNRGGYDNRGPGARPPVGRPNGPRYNDQRDRNRPQYDARRYRPSYNAPQRYRAPAWRPPIGYYAYNWRFGDYLPNSWFGSSYYLNWAGYGLPMPPIGCEWVRVGDDALLVDRFTGRVLSVYYDLFW